MVGGDVNLFPVAGMPPGHAGVPAAPGIVGTIAQGRFRDQSPVGQFVETGEGHSCRSSFGVRALGVHMKGGIRFMGSAQFPTTWRLVAAKAKRHRGG
jgi:hypothetical protein